VGRALGTVEQAAFPDASDVRGSDELVTGAQDVRQRAERARQLERPIGRRTVGVDIGIDALAWGPDKVAAVTA
jgi:hypothetical protein